MNLASAADVLRVYGADMIESKGTKVVSTCPLARWTHRSGSSDHQSFVVLQTRSGAFRYQCLSCGRGGRIEGLLWEMAKHQGHTNRDAMMLIYDPFGLAPTERPPVVYEYRIGGAGVGAADRVETRVGDWVEDRGNGFLIRHAAEGPARPPEWLAGAVARWQRAPYPEYAARRGISVAAYQEWGLGYDSRSHRLVVPIYGLDGEVVATTARLAFDDVDATCVACGEPRVDPSTGKRRYACGCGFRYAKWVHSKGFDRRHMVFGLSRVPEGSVVAIAEGPLDVIAMWERGVRYPLALLGAKVSPEQLDLLAERGILRAWCVGDGDQAGEAMNTQVSEGLRVRAIDCSVIQLPAGEDPGSVDASVFRRAVFSVEADAILR